jgi:surface polysaccharide O-acyltransferase-like enzyme
VRAREHNWDRLRVLAMLDVVAFHLSGHYLFAGMGLPLFHMLAVALSARARPHESLQAAWTQRSRRLLAPWLFWSLSIALLRVISNWQHDKALSAGFEPRMLLYGASIHLWFLPFSLVSTSLARGLARHCDSAAPRAFWPAALVATAFALLPLPLYWNLGWPFDQWLFSLPACMLGFWLGRSRAAGGSALLAAGTLGCAALLAMHAAPRLSAHLARFALALLALIAASLLPNLGDRITPRLTPLLLGIYILHPVLFEYALHDWLWRHGLGQAAWARVGAGLLLSAGLVALLRKSPLRRFV